MDGGVDNGQAQDPHKKDAKMEKKWEGPQRDWELRVLNDKKMEKLKNTTLVNILTVNIS